MHLVKNEEKYWDFIRNLRNDPSTQLGWIVQNPNITREQQDEYMAIHNDEYYICIKDDVPIGYVGAVDSDIRIATHPDHLKQGIGYFMMNEFMKIEPTAFAKVKIDNLPSIRFFEAAGFNLSCLIYTKNQEIK